MIKSVLKQLSRLFLFWITLFFLGRLFFLIYNQPLWKDATILEFLQTFWCGLYLDISTTCYILSVPFLLLGIQLISRLKALDYIHYLYNYIFIIIFTSITLIEPELYHEWRTKFSDKALYHLFNHPDEVIRTINGLSVSIFLVSFVLLVSLKIYLFHKFFFKNLNQKKTNWFTPVLYFVIGPWLLVMGMRGGIEPIPISQSNVYFSKSHEIFNIAAINSIWNIGQTYDANKGNGGVINPHQYFSSISEAKEIVRKMTYTKVDTTENILQIEKPNILIIILESWSADLIKELGGFEGVTPRFSDLIQDGILFTKHLSSANLSDQGMGAIFSAFPSNIVSIVTSPPKSKYLPFIMSDFKNQDYHTSFYFGGDLTYGNILAYLYSHNVDKIVDQSDYPKRFPSGRLGIHDEHTFSRLQQELAEEKGPFFSAYFSLSTHSPYDVPLDKEYVSFGGRDKKYLNSAYYTDRELGNFMKEAKKSDWYKNTLIIITADHSHVTPKNNSYYHWKHHHVPLLITGGALSDSLRGSTYKKWSNHVDIASTILHQFNWNKAAEKYTYSRNLFNPYRFPYAYYQFNNGSGLVSDSAHVSYNRNSQSYHFEKFSPSFSERKKENFRKMNLAFLQKVYQDFLDADNFIKKD